MKKYFESHRLPFLWYGCLSLNSRQFNLLFSCVPFCPVCHVQFRWTFVCSVQMLVTRYRWDSVLKWSIVLSRSRHIAIVTLSFMVQAIFKIYMQNRFADTVGKTAHVYIVGKDRVEIESMFFVRVWWKLSCVFVCVRKLDFAVRIRLTPN